MSRVFVLEPTKLDVEKAKTYGTLVYVFNNGDRRASIWTEEFIEQVMTRLQSLCYDPDGDYVAIVGHLVPMAVVIARLTYDYDHFQALCFSSTEREYVVRVLGGDDTDEEDGTGPV